MNLATVKFIFIALIFFILNTLFAGSEPRYIKLDITKGKNFTGADNTLYLDFKCLSWNTWQFSSSVI